jgi:hypothetical protein
MFKKWSLIILVILVSSCGLLKDKKKEKTKEIIKLIDRSVMTETAPGDRVNVWLPYPLPNPKRPKNETRTYKGNSGATVDVGFDSTGVVNNIIADCPEVNKATQKNIELDYSLRERKQESSMNVELAKIVGNRLVLVGLFFAVAWWARKRIA